MPDPVSSSTTPSAVPVMGQGETYEITPTREEKEHIAAARAARARQGYGFYRSYCGRHRLVGFDYNKALLKPAHMKYIRNAVLKQAKEMGGRPRFWVCGYASRSGAAKGNQALSMRRARAVATYIKKLLPEARVDVQAAGEGAPYARGAKDGSEDPMDRAVEIGVAKADLNVARQKVPSDRKAEQRKLMYKLFDSLAAESSVLQILKTVDHTTAQSIKQSTSSTNRAQITDSKLLHILQRAWPTIHKKFPEMTLREVTDALVRWQMGRNK